MKKYTFLFIAIPIVLLLMTNIGNSELSFDSDDFIRPTDGRVSFPYGTQMGQNHHYGIDISSDGIDKLKVVSVADGIVQRSYFSTQYGNVVFIKHTVGGQDYETVYAHMRNRDVKQGERVKQGQFLGYMGTTGQSTAEHLHFEIHKNKWTVNKSNAINPASVIKF